MIDQLIILAEAGHEATEGVPPQYIGIGAFITMLVLLGIASLVGGSHQRDEDSEHHTDH